MRSRKTNVIGLVINNARASFNIQVIRGAYLAADEYSYDLMIYTSHYKNGVAREKWEQHQVSRLNGSLTDGLVIAAPLAASFSTLSPLVGVDAHSETTNYPVVIATNHQGALQVMTYLTDLGHRRIGFITGKTYLQSSMRRLQGYKDGLQAANISVDPDLIQIGDYFGESGFNCGLRLLSLKSPPTAIFAANDMMAIGVVKAARQLGVCVPDDVSIVGFDNIPETVTHDPPLTTIDQDIEKMGYVATEMVIQLLQGKPIENKLHKISTHLVIRNSCAAPAAEKIIL
jgi:LacI family transcriptional regulator